MTIGKSLGGLLEVALETRTFSFLKYAKIKVGRLEGGFHGSHHGNPMSRLKRINWNLSYFESQKILRRRKNTRIDNKSS